MKIKTVYSRGLKWFNESLIPIGGFNLSMFQTTVLAIAFMASYYLIMGGIWYPLVIIIPASLYITFAKSKRYEPIEHIMNAFNFVMRNAKDLYVVEPEKPVTIKTNEPLIPALIKKIRKKINNRKITSPVSCNKNE